MVELLAGPLVGAAHVNQLAAKNWGNFVFALHPRMMGDATKLPRRFVTRREPNPHTDGGSHAASGHGPSDATSGVDTR